MSAPVAIIMGSKSDWETMSAAAETLGGLGVPHEVKVVSAQHPGFATVDAGSKSLAMDGPAPVVAYGGLAHTLIRGNSPELGLDLQDPNLRDTDRRVDVVEAARAEKSPAVEDSELIAHAVLAAAQHVEHRQSARGRIQPLGVLAQAHPATLQ